MFDWINMSQFELSENMIIAVLVVLIIATLIIKKKRSMKSKNKNSVKQVKQVDNIVSDDKGETESVSSSRRSSRFSQLPGYEELYGYPVQ